ncbi:FecR domain-containing protein [Methylomagnum sp.]
MQKLHYALLLCCLTGFAGLVHATTAGVVEAVQWPAWVDRQGKTVPGAPGISLRPGDTLRTGPGARLRLKLGEGSTVKLGENAEFAIERTEQSQQGVYQAMLSVLKGAFRFTTGLATRHRPRDIAVSVGGNATIGLRGTDFWGRGREDKDIVCLIEGDIEITGNDNKRLKLDQPLQFFQSTRKAPPQPIGKVPKEKLAEWSAETEMDSRKEVQAGGGWRIVIGGFASAKAVRQVRERLRNAGYPAERGAGKSLVIAHLSEAAGAAQLAERLKGEFGLKELRVAR